MPSANGFLELLNASSGAAPVLVDAAVLRLLLRALGLAVLAIAGTAALAAARAVSDPRRGRSREPARASAGEGSATDGALAEALYESRRQLEAMVRKTNDRNNYINSIFSSIEDGLLLVDPDGGVALYNPRAMELLGLGPELFFGRRDDPARGEAAVAEILAACRRVGAAASAEHDSPAAPDSPAAQETLQLETGAGRYLSVRIRAITDKYRSGREFGSLAVIGDVTEFRKLEIQKKDFVANVSHEFRTPLTLISGFIEMFRMGGVIPEADRSRAFEIMDLEAERLKRLVSELLTLSEMESELPFHDEDAIRVAEVLARLAQSLEGLAARKGLSLRVEIGRDLPALYGNENWFYLAVKNLVENAIKYSPGGTGGEVRLAASARDGAVCIEVSDTGIGIAEAELERVFERFYRVEKARGSGRGGSGLGLALVKDVAAMFGGRVSVRSALGKGSEFALTLPVRKSGEENVSGGTHGH